MGMGSSTGLERGCLKSKVQCCATFSLCAGLVVVSLLVFTFAIETVEVTSMRQPWLSLEGPRLEFISLQSRWRLLGSGRKMSGNLQGGRGPKSKGRAAALQGMGTLFRTGTRAMQEVIVAHLTEDTSSEELRLFLRTLHRSGSTARADVVILFPSSPMLDAMAAVIREEEESFQKLVAAFTSQDDSSEPHAQTASPIATAADPPPVPPLSPFNAMAFKKAGEDKQESGEVLWGRRGGGMEAEKDDVSMSPTWAAWGSVVSFDMQELDPHDALQGFFDTPPVQLRRWVCYDMLLGMIKSRYKNVLLAQVKGVFVLGDVLSVIRRKQSLYITAEDLTWSDAVKEAVTERGAEEHMGARGQDVEAPRSIVQGIGAAASRHEVNRRMLREDGKLQASEDGGGDEETSEGSEQGIRVGSREEGESESTKLRSAGGVQKEAKTWRHSNGLIQSVYGPQVWNSMEKGDKQQVVVSTGVIMGGLQFVRGLADKMTSEIVRVAMARKSRRTFHDKAVLNMLIHKRSVLGKRISDHLRVVHNQDSVVHSLQGSQQPYEFWRKRFGIVRYLVLHQGHAERGGDVTSDLQADLCRLDSSLYEGCQ